jgi:hypothetical protein
MRGVVLPLVLALVVLGGADGGAQQTQQRPQSEQTPPMDRSDMDVGSTNYVAAGCRDFIARRAHATNPYAQGLCAGKVEAVAVFATGICYPSDATVGQMIRVVVRYIDERPARLHENFLILAREAMQATWPCRR